MSYKESQCETNRKLELTGSQVNLTSRSDQTSLGYCSRNRPGSAAQSCRNEFEDKFEFIRPKSAEFPNFHSDSFHWPFISSDNKQSGDPSITVSHFTNSSSKLLQNLLETCNLLVTDPESENFLSEKLTKESSCKAESKKSPTTENNLEAEHMPKLSKKDHLCTDVKPQSEFLEDIKNTEKENSNFYEITREKNVRFSEESQLGIGCDQQLHKQCTCLRQNENFYSCLENKMSSFNQGISGREETYDELEELEAQEIVNHNHHKENTILKIFNSDDDSEDLKDKETVEKKTLNEKWGDLPKSPSSEVDMFIENKLSTRNEMLALSSDEDIQTELKKVDHEVTTMDSKNICTNQKTDVSNSTYDEIVQLLQTLDEEESESLNLECKQDSSMEIPLAEVSPKEKIDYLSAVSSYLEEVEKNDCTFHENYANSEKWNSKHFTSPRLEELLSKSSVELAHEVFSLKIQMEDQKKGIKLLKDTLAEMKEAKKVAELEHQEALQKVSSEAENLVQRHQKFIKQLINEKKNLNETVSKLVQDLRSGEERHKKNIKAMEEKHLVEIKRAKEAQAVADKIRREKWMENKTQKIKEMTVKGLEPELTRLAARQQEELTELRNLHKAEIEAIELRAARRTSELMDDLRAELTKEKERAIAKETATLRANMEKDFEDERNKFQQYHQNLKERIRKLEQKLSNQEFEFQQRLSDYKQEEEKKKQRIIREHDENLEEVRRQHLVEIRNLKETAEAEKEVALNNYKKMQVIKFNEREAELRQQYKKERDREIEMVIETLEKESTQVQLELNTANENKLKRLKEKMEAEIKEVEANEAALKEKLSEAKANLAGKEDDITELNSQIRQLQTELNFFKKSCDEMSTEKAKLKEIIRKEFESTINGCAKEKENLEKDIAVLKELHAKELAKKDQQNAQAKYEMQRELTRVYSRIKTAVSKKEKIIESLREENESINQKCRQLEFMLDQQRRNLLLQ